MVNVPFIKLKLGTAGSFHHAGRGSTKMSAESQVATASQSSIFPRWGEALTLR